MRWKMTTVDRRSPITDADETLRLAKDFVETNALQVPNCESLVPGKQKGFVVVPLRCLPGELMQGLHERAIGAVEAARKVKMAPGHKCSFGADLVIWMAISEPQEIRRRSKVTARLNEGTGNPTIAATGPDPQVANLATIGVINESAQNEKSHSGRRRKEASRRARLKRTTEEGRSTWGTRK